MSTTTPFKKLYRADKNREPFWKRFEEIGGFAHLSKGYLANRLDLLLSQPFVLATQSTSSLPHNHERRISFVEGAFDKEGSYFPEATLLSLTEASSLFASFMEGRLQKITSKEKSALVTLNGAFATEGAFLHLPAGSIVEEVVEVAFLNRSAPSGSSLLLSPRLQIVVGKNSQLTLKIEQQTGQGICLNQAIDLYLEEGAQVKIVTLFAGDDEGALFDSLRATLKTNSRLEMHLLSLGAKVALRDYHVELIGENASADLKAALSLQARRQEQLDVIMEHKAAHCTSYQMIKQVGYYATRHSFSGKIYVHKMAKETTSYQRHNALLLDPTAFSAVQPNLEIFTDEVKASHGATAGQLSEEALFYFTSRGLSRKCAEALLIEAHLKEILDSIANREIRARAESMVS